MVDYKRLRKKLDEKRYDEITEEEQAVLNDVLRTILEAFEPLLEYLACGYAELLKIAELFL